VSAGAASLLDSSIAELAGRLARNEVSSREITEAALSRAAADRLGAFLRVTPEAAHRAARASDERRARGAALSPLDGVPLGLKDIFLTEGVETTAGSRILQGFVPPCDATVVERLRACGAVFLGKLNMDEFAMGSSNENSAYGPCRNPWDPTRTPGGSSGGSAAAVAARQVFGALGTDTGGSIRQPASFCGVVGVKPTYGRVSRYGVIAFASSLDQVGPFARTVEDLALVSAALFGHDPLDSTSATEPVPDLARALEGSAKGLRVGVPWAFLLQGVEDETMARFRESLAALESAGASVSEVSLPHLPHAIAAYYLVATAEASSNLARYDGVRYGRRAPAARELRRLYGDSRDAGLGAEVKRRIILGTFALSSGYYDAYYLRAQKVRTLIRRDFERAFAACDVVATPTTPTPAFRLGEKTGDPLQMYLADIFTVPANLAGLPGLSLPCGLVRGLPVGLQLLARSFEEETLLRAGAAFQKATRHHELAPPV